MELTDSQALGWLEEWDSGNMPPKGRERLLEIIANVHQYGQRGYGSAYVRTGRPGRNGTHFSAPNREGGSEEKPDEQPHLTDLGNARRVVARHGRDMHFCHPWKLWFVWQSCRWAEDATAEAVRRVKETQGSLYRSVAAQVQELGEVGDDEERKAQVAKLMALLRHALKWEERKKIFDCLELARSESGVPVLPGDLDRNTMLLNVHNGTLDLNTGRLREHRREDLITKLAPVEYDPTAPCPIWDRFLTRIMDGKADLVNYLRRVIGYCLTGDVTEQALWFFHGKGANGKSTFLGTILALLGDYAIQSVPELLMIKNNETHPTERADLFGKRFVATIETDEGKRMAESLMKQLTSGDKIRARKMRQDFFEFLPTHKLFLAANHKPVVRGTDLAAWRRIKLVPFTVTIPDQEKDKTLPNKLKGELPGILAWAVRGCLEWRQGGLQEPREVREATEGYRIEQDTVGGFLESCCTLHPDLRVRVKALHEAYLEWSGDKMTSREAFGRRLKDMGYVNQPGHGKVYFWHGIGLEAQGGGGSEWSDS
jgi:putative DNA primase/helicase